MSDDPIERQLQLFRMASRARAKTADRIEADEALMRQALEALEYWVADEALVEAEHEQALWDACEVLAALRARLGESK